MSNLVPAFRDSIFSPLGDPAGEILEVGIDMVFENDALKSIPIVNTVRALVSHEYSLSAFDDLQAEYIHFLEILVHAQMLKRAGIDDAGIELIIGIVFHCNFKYMEFLQKGNTKGEEPAT